MDWSHVARGETLSSPPDLAGLHGVIEDIAAHHHQDDHEGHADIEVGAGLAPFGQDPLLDLDAHPHPDARGGRHDQAQLDVNLAVLPALIRPHHGLGELVAHVAGHGHGPGDPQAHHPRGQDKGAAGADEAAHQAADETYDKQKKYGH